MAAAKRRRNDLTIVPASVADAGADVPPAAVETMEMDAPADRVTVKAAALSRLRMLSHYAFYTDEGAFMAWADGVVVSDPDEIELLTARKAPAERIEE